MGQITESKTQIIIDGEFKHLMPPLGAEAYASLEAGIFKDGCLSPLVLWGKILVDGHNRYEICKKHDIPFEVASMEFTSRDEAALWIIEMQAGRRNLTPMQLTYYRGLHYRKAKKVAGNKTGESRLSNKWSQNDTISQEKRTSSSLAGKYHVSRGTIMRDAKASEGVDAIGEVSQIAKAKLLSHEVQIGKQVLEGVASAPKEEIAELARKIEEGTYEKPRPSHEYPTTDSADIQTKAIPSFAYDTNAITSERSDHNDPYISEIIVSCNTLIAALSTGTPRQKKQAVRDHINTLEEMYAEM